MRKRLGKPRKPRTGRVVKGREAEAKERAKQAALVNAWIGKPEQERSEVQSTVEAKFREIHSIGDHQKKISLGLKLAIYIQKKGVPKDFYSRWERVIKEELRKK